LVLSPGHELESCDRKGPGLEARTWLIISSLLTDDEICSLKNLKRLISVSKSLQKEAIEPRLHRLKQFLELTVFGRCVRSNTGFSGKLENIDLYK
jgi:hypothetical protein